VTSLPLTGKTILVTRSAGQSSQFTALLQQQGATVLELPAIEITPPSSWDVLDRAIAQLEQLDWLILTSTNGVDYFFERLAAQGKTIQDLSTLKIAVVGQKTALRLQGQGRQPDFIPPDFVADSLIEHFPAAVPGLKILFPRVETGGREVLVKELTAKGAEVIEVPAYQSGCAQAIAPPIAAALQHRQIDIITFASSKTVSCFHQLLNTLPDLHGSSPILATPYLASIGPQTSATCQKLFGRVDIEAEDYTLDGLTQAIVKWVLNQHV
jgi:uroporphyrinogen III methyltransferase/synthase